MDNDKHCTKLWNGLHCGGTLIKVKADEPYNPEYYICGTCDSTYTVDQIEKPNQNG